jgi:ubiquinone/menaquinone biosynthesis C-methylase UbiE
MAIDYDEIAPEYAQRRKLHPGVLKELISQVKPGVKSSILEVGCGTGNYIAALKSVSSAGSCWGIDSSLEMLRHARKCSSAITFQLAAAETIGLRDGCFDLVFSVDLIHHISNRREHFLEAFRVLKSGGRICTVTDSEWIIRNRKPLTRYFPESLEIELERYPAISQLRELMVNVGFRDLAEKTVDFHYPLQDISPFQNKTFSCLHLISTAAFERGIGRMKQDLQAGPIPCVSRYSLLWGTK